MNSKEDFLIFAKTKETDSQFYITGLYYVGWENGLLKRKIKRIEKYISQRYEGSDISQNTVSQEKFDSKFIPPILSPVEDEDIVVKTNSNLVLFIQAEAGEQLLMKISENNKLLPEFSNDLYLYTMYLWVGNETEFNHNPIKTAFEKNANSGVIPKYDFVMLLFELCSTYKGFEKKAISYDRIDFFNDICQDKLSLIQTSKRLAFENLKDMNPWER